MSLTLQNLSVGYAGKPVVKDLETTAHAGDFIGLVGPNGAGKSSLLKTLAGILPPLGGDALFGPQSLFSMPRKMRARTLAYLPQDKHANWPLPVQDLITLGRAPHLGSLGKLSGPDKDAVKTAARRSGCEDLLRRNYQDLSGGEQARVHMARTLAVGAKILLVDEPLNGLDPYYQHTMMQVLKAQAHAGNTVLAAVHDLDIARQYCSRIWVLHQGQLCADDTPKSALTDEILKSVFRINRDENGHYIPV